MEAALPFRSLRFPEGRERGGWGILVSRFWPRSTEVELRSVNPDFSQVEADAVQLDVNQAFALFFPERRPFFQEGADVFEIPIRALFTRTILDPVAGGKVTGKWDAYAFGAMLVADEVNALLLPGPQASSSVLLDEPVTRAVGRLRADAGFQPQVGVRGGDLSVERVVRGGRERWFSRLSAQAGAWRNGEIGGPLVNGGGWVGVGYGGPLQTSFHYFLNVFREGFAGREWSMTSHFVSAGACPSGSPGFGVTADVGGAVDFANARRARRITLSPRLDLRLGRRTLLDLSHRLQRLATERGGIEILAAHVSEEPARDLSLEPRGRTFFLKLGYAWRP